MNHYSVLLVDDEDEFLEPSVQLFLQPFDVTISVPQVGKQLKRIITVKQVNVVLQIAKTLQEALERIRKSFFHLALIDPRLQRDRDDILEGNILLKQIKELRPSCERIINTDLGRNMGVGAEIIALELDPLDGNAKHLVIKMFSRYLEVIKNRAGFWMLFPILVNSPRLVVDMLKERFQKRQKTVEIAITDDEIDFLVSSIFGQGKEWSQVHGGIGIDGVELEHFTDQGFSLAAIVKATGYSSMGQAGIPCVLKFANRDYIGKELVKYSQYVRFRVNVHHRVELLDWEIGDKFGVLCYNFAGVTSLTKQFLQGNQLPSANPEDPVFQTLGRLFDPNGKKWYRESHKVILDEYFRTDPHNLDVAKIKYLITIFANTYSEQVVGLSSTRDIINAALNKPIFKQVLEGCIVHGDLHCDNVLVGQDGAPMCIDFSTVGPGPRAIDFATLEASTRLLYLQRISLDGKKINEDHRSDDEIIPALFGLCKAEDEIWKSVWLTVKPNESDRPRAFWELTSEKIAWLAKENFRQVASSDPPSLAKDEYSATCLMWAFRLFRIEKLQQRAKVRLFVWIMSLARMLTYRSEDG